MDGKALNLMSKTIRTRKKASTQTKIPGHARRQVERTEKKIESRPIDDKRGV